MAALLCLVALAVPVARRIGQPLPVIVAAVGLTVGTGSVLLDLQIADEALYAYDLWLLNSLTFDSELLIYLFLPPLLYEMALAVEVRRMLADSPTIALLAVVAVLVATALVGLSVWALSPVSLVGALLLGAAVSTTDPAAVITTFKEIGAPRRLLAILEGESLLNDAAAIAIFVLLVGIVTEQAAVEPVGVVGGFLYSFAVGAVTGFVVAFAGAQLYPWLGRSAVAETSLTVAVAYGAFLISKLPLDASGVVAAVVAGLTTSSFGFVRMGPRNWTSVQAVWTQIGFWANTFILLLVAFLTPRLLLQLSWDQALIVLLVYAAAMVARGVMLFGALPVVSRLGLSEPLGRNQSILLWWGGVRGAVTLVLALSVSEIDGLGPEAPVIGALAAAFTLMTLVVNASTLAWMTGLLGLDRLSPSDLALRDNIVAGALERVRTIVRELADQRALEPEAVDGVIAALVDRQRDARSQSDALAEGHRIPFGERLRLGLTIISGQEKRLVRRAFEEGAIGPRTTNDMSLLVEQIGDAARSEGRPGYERACEAALRPSRRYRLALGLQRYLKVDRPVRLAIQLRTTSLLEFERIVRALDEFAGGSLGGMVGADATANIRQLLAWRLQRIRDEIDATSRQYPIYVAALERAVIARSAIRRERHQYERLFADGVIGSELFDSLAGDADRRDQELGRPPQLDLTVSARDLVLRVPLFAVLDGKRRRRLARRMRTVFVTPDQVVLPAGERDAAAYFVVSGVLEIRDGSDEPTRLSNGDFVGDAALFAPNRRRSAAVVSVGFGRLLRLSRRDFRRLARRDPAIAGLLQGDRNLSPDEFAGLMDDAASTSTNPAGLTH